MTRAKVPSGKRLKMSTTEKDLTENTTTTDTPAHDELGLDLAWQELESMGRFWATHGLRTGAAALHTSAATLGSVAGLLGQLASHFDPKAPVVDSDPPTT